MIQVMVTYPKRDGSRFDMDYYCGRHIPLVREKLGAALLGVTVEEGVAGEEPGAAPVHAVICNLRFASPESFQAAFAPVADAILGDIPNYTDLEPLVQINRVVL